MALRIFFALMGWFCVVMPVQAQMPPTPASTATVPMTNYGATATTPPVATQLPVPTANQAKPLPDPNQVAPMTQAESYIWFGNDQINNAALLIKAGRYVEALALLDKVIQRDMRLSEAHLLQGISYMQMKDFPRAKQSFNLVLAIDRAYLGAYIYLADIAVQEKDDKQAQVYLQAIKAVCVSTDCAEYQYLQNALRARNIKVPD